jgi:metallophosphoesterase (TIGR00282 family)
MLKILFIGDIIGSPGRSAVANILPKLKEKYQVNLTIANGENLAGGLGITPETANEIISYGVDVITTGNHVWDKKEILDYISMDNRILRPANYPEGAPGNGFMFHRLRLPQDVTVAILNMSGCVFMQNLDNPFHVADSIIPTLRGTTKNIIVDFHAEATSEKIAMARYLDGQVSAVIGTHTHVQTADETIFPNGTAYITDAGMTGPKESIIGTRIDQIINKFRTQMPVKFEVPKGDVIVCAVLIEIDPDTGKSISIKRLQEIVNNQ